MSFSGSSPGKKQGGAGAKGAPSSAQRLARERADAARERLAAAQRRRRMITIGAPVAAVVLVLAVLVVVRVAVGGNSPKSGVQASKAATGVTAKVENVPAGVLDAVGTGSASAKPNAITAPALTQDGKPLIVYIGAEYCPYCAAERWAVAVALSRFGTFTNLGQTASSPSDVYPSTPTLTFHGASYTSKYLVLSAKEIESNQVVNGQYAPLDKLTAAEEKLFSTYDKSPYVSGDGGIPFVDLGGRYVFSGATYDPQVLHGKTHAQVAAALSDPSSAVAKAVLGSANLITAAICSSTGQQPAAVCTSSGVRAAAAALGGSG